MSPSAESVYPIFLTQLRDALVVVVGGGKVAQRKVAGLLAVGAQVRIVSPALTPELAEWQQTGLVAWTARLYEPGDLADAYLAFAATDQREVNALVAHEATERRILCNVADAPDEGTFHLPAVHRHPGIVIAVGSGGSDPAQSKRVRDQIAALLETMEATGERS
jgi:cobalt-precorrin 5A hydrolase/precorrin-3B C17-methyltransferase